MYHQSLNFPRTIVQVQKFKGPAPSSPPGFKHAFFLYTKRALIIQIFHVQGSNAAMEPMGDGKICWQIIEKPW